MNKIITSIALSLLLLGTAVFSEAASLKKIQVLQNTTSQINAGYFYEKIFDPNTNVTCYSFIAPHDGVGISCVKN